MNLATQSQTEQRDLSYFEEISKEVQSIKERHLVDSSERQEALEIVISNVLSECSSDPVTVLCDASTSKIVQSFFDDASWETQSSFLQALCSDLFEICCKCFSLGAYSG